MNRATVERQEVASIEGKTDTKPVTIQVGQWNPDDSFSKSENFERYKFMYPQYHYHITIEGAERFIQENGARIRFFIKNYDTERQIEKLVCSVNNNDLTFFENFIDLNVEGSSQKELVVHLSVYFSDGATRNHRFKIWYFPIEEYQSRGLATKASRIVAEKSTIPFQAPITFMPIGTWLSLSDIEKSLIGGLADQLSDTNKESTTINRARFIMRYLNKNVKKGYSTIHPEKMTPSEIMAAARQKPITHFCYNFLTTAVFCSMGIPARMIIKRGVQLGENFGLEGDGYAMEYFDVEKNRLILCSPWLNILNIDAANDYSLDLYDFMQMVRMNQTNQLTMSTYDSNLDNFSDYHAETSSEYDIGFENYYTIGFEEAVEALHHNIKTGNIEFWPIKTLLKKYYPQTCAAGADC